MKYESGADFGRQLPGLMEVAASGGCVAITYEERIDVAPASEPRWMRMMHELAVAKKILACAYSKHIYRVGEQMAERDMGWWHRHYACGVALREIARAHGLHHASVAERVAGINMHIEDFLARFGRLAVPSPAVMPRTQEKLAS